MLRMYIPIFLTLFFLAPLGSSAQVTKCVDQKTGRVTYVDTQCSDRGAGTLLERQQTPQEIQAERLQALQASEKEYLDQVRRADTKFQERRVAQPAAFAQQLPSSDKSTSFECKKAQKDWETVSAIRSGAAEYRRNRINAEILKVNAECGTQTALMQAPATVKINNYSGNPPKPTTFTNCNEGFCYDNLGGTYARSGSEVLVGPNGRTCNRAGVAWVCN